MGTVGGCLFIVFSYCEREKKVNKKTKIEKPKIVARSAEEWYDLHRDEFRGLPLYQRDRINDLVARVWKDCRDYTQQATLPRG